MIVFFTIDGFPSDVTTRQACAECGFVRKVVLFQNINNLFNTEFSIRKITITTSTISSGLRPQIPPHLPIGYTITFLHLIPYQFILERSIIP